jgi:hypothetical protein
MNSQNSSLPGYSTGGSPKKKGGMSMKKAICSFMGWVTLVVGVVLFIIPGLPGAPILLLSKFLFSI